MTDKSIGLLVLVTTNSESLFHSHLLYHVVATVCNHVSSPRIRVGDIIDGVWRRKSAHARCRDGAIRPKLTQRRAEKAIPSNDARYRYCRRVSIAVDYTRLPPSPISKPFPFGSRMIPRGFRRVAWPSQEQRYATAQAIRTETSYALTLVPSSPFPAVTQYGEEPGTGQPTPATCIEGQRFFRAPDPV